MFRGGPRLDGVYQASAPHSLKGIRFTFVTGGPIRATPAVADGVLYVASADHILYALDASSGRERWRFDSGEVIASSPAVANGLVFVANRKGRLFGLATATGAVKWTADLGADLGVKNYWDFYTSSPTLAGRALYIGSGDGHVYAFDASSGRKLWAYDAGSRVRSTPAVSDDAVVFGTNDGHVVAIDRATGARRWSFATDGAGYNFARKNNDTTSVFASPTIAEGMVVIGGRDGMIYGLDLKTGAQVWKTTHDGGSWILSTAAADGIAYIGSGSASFLQAADIKTGKERWRFRISGAMFGSPSLVGDTIVFNDFKGDLYAIDRQGKELWEFPVGARGMSTPAMAGSTLYIGSDLGVLYALDTSTAPPPSGAEPKRYVYWEAANKDDKTGYFAGEVDRAIFGFFQVAGYETLDGKAMAEAMQRQIKGGGRSVIVFAADRIPPGVLGDGDANALLRRYLDAGGHVVFMGQNPAQFSYAKDTGAIIGGNGDAAEKMLGLHYPPPENERGYHISTPTAEGRRWGLRNLYVTNGAIDPAQVSQVLALNEFGLATSWVKRFGDKGGSLVQLCASPAAVGSMQEFEIVAEHTLL